MHTMQKFMLKAAWSMLSKLMLNAIILGAAWTDEEDKQDDSKRTLKTVSCIRGLESLEGTVEKQKAETYQKIHQHSKVSKPGRMTRK
jgi:hypothetical protein